MIGENIGIDLMLLDINMPQMNGFEVLGAIGTGTVANNVSLLARYVSLLKKSESSRKELSGFCVCLFECNRVEKRTKFRKLEPPPTLIWPQCLSPMVLKEVWGADNFWT